MIFELYFESTLDAEKAQLYQKLSNLITEYKEDENWIKIELPNIGESPENTLKQLIKNIWDGNDKVVFDFVSPRMMTHIKMSLNYPIKFTVWDTDKFKKIEL